MKKILIVAFVSVVALTGCSWGKKKAIEQAVDQNQTVQEVKEEVKKLSDWLTGGQSVVCVVKTDAGDIVMKTKNNKVRTEASINLATTTETNDIKLVTSITDGDWMYTWSENQGTKMNIQKMKELASTSEEQTKPEDQKTWEDNVKDYEQASLSFSCEEQELTDDLFIPPADINFVDMTEITENMKKFGQDLQNKINTGENVNQEELEERLNKAMEGVNIPQ